MYQIFVLNTIDVQVYLLSQYQFEHDQRYQIMLRAEFFFALMTGNNFWYGKKRLAKTNNLRDNCRLCNNLCELYAY